MLMIKKVLLLVFLFLFSSVVICYGGSIKNMDSHNYHIEYVLSNGMIRDFILQQNATRGGFCSSGNGCYVKIIESGDIIYMEGNDNAKIENGKFILE